MIIQTEGKLRILIELRHQNNDVSIGFVYVDNQEDVLKIFTQKNTFIPFELLDNEFIFIALSDVRAFKIIPTQKSDLYNIWSFDPYVVMGVETDINSHDLQQKYISLLKQTHPDVIDTSSLHPAFKILATDMTRRIMSAFEFIRAELSLNNHR